MTDTITAAVATTAETEYLWCHICNRILCTFCDNQLLLGKPWANDESCRNLIILCYPSNHGCIENCLVLGFSYICNMNVLRFL